MPSMMRIDRIIIDDDIYPRTGIDYQRVHEYARKLRAGAVFDPILIDEKTGTLIDGRHRVKARELIGDNKIRVVKKKYRDKREMFLDAARMNDAHGKGLDSSDRVHCILRADVLGISDSMMAAALSITVEEIGELRAERVGEIAHIRTEEATDDVHDDKARARYFPTKPATRHYRKKFTREQEQINRICGGDTQSRLARQLIGLLSTGLLEPREAVYLLLWQLHDLIETYVPRVEQQEKVRMA